MEDAANALADEMDSLWKEMQAGFTVTATAWAR
jgi:hypothetical protein